MIRAALVLVLAGAGLFVAGVLTGLDILYWLCVASCAVAAALLVVARRRLPGSPAAEGSLPADGAGPAKEPADRAPAPPAPPAEEPPAPVLADPPAEDVEVTDLLLVVDLKDEVLVLDERPRYHLAGCIHLRGREAIPLPHDEARADGFTPCGVCEPDHTLADQVRARKAANNG